MIKDYIIFGLVFCLLFSSVSALTYLENEGTASNNLTMFSSAVYDNVLQNFNFTKGSNSYLNATNAVTFDRSVDNAWCEWVMLKSYDNNSSLTHYGLSQSSTNWGLYVKPQANKATCFVKNSTGVESNDDWTINSTAWLNIGHMVCCVYNTTRIETCVDGTCTGSPGVVTGATGTTTSQLLISNTGVTTAFNGSLDNVQLWQGLPIRFTSAELSNITLNITTQATYRTLSYTFTNDSISNSSFNCTPSENKVYNESCVMPYNTVYSLADAGVDGAIYIGANNIILDCNGSTLQGSNTGIGINILSSYLTNVTIKNCEIYDYDTAIYLVNGSSWNVYHNVFHSYKRAGTAPYTRGIYIRSNNTINASVGSHLIHDNNFTVSIFRAVDLWGAYNDSYYNNIIYMVLNGFTYSYANGTKTYNNSVSNANFGAYRMNPSDNWNNIVANNTAETAEHNCYDVMGYNNSFTGNYGTNCTHGGINANTDYPATSGHNGNNYIAHNIINFTWGCIYINDLFNSVFYNNTCDRSTSVRFSADEPASSRGIGEDSRINSTTNINYWTVINNTFDYNKFYNYEDAIIEETYDANSTYRNNIFYGSNYSRISLNSGYSEDASNTSLRVTLINNSRLNNYSYYYIYFDRSKYLNIEDLNPSGAYIVFQEGADESINKTYDGLMNLTINNMTVNFTLSDPFDDIKNLSSGLLLSNNTNNFMITLSNGLGLLVGNYTPNDPVSCLNFSNGSSINFDNVSFSYCNLVLVVNSSLIYLEALDPVNVSLNSLRTWFPFNDLFNLSSNSTLVSNVDNYSLLLNDGVSVVVGNYSSLSYVCSDVVVDHDLNVSCSVLDPDGVYSYIGVSVYNNLNVLVDYGNFTGLVDELIFSGLGAGSYYYRVYVHTDSLIIESDDVSFIIGDVPVVAESPCDAGDSSLWAVFITVFILGFVYFAYDGLMNGNPNSLGIFFILLTMAVVFMSSMINVLRGLC